MTPFVLEHRHEYRKQVPPYGLIIKQNGQEFLLPVIGYKVKFSIDKNFGTYTWLDINHVNRDKLAVLIFGCDKNHVDMMPLGEILEKKDLKSYF